MKETVTKNSPAMFPNGSKSGTESSSDSSSEDEESARKIAAAVGDSSIMQICNTVASPTGPVVLEEKKSVSRHTNKTRPSSMGCPINGSDLQKLKSNRPVDRNDDKDNILHTTPEFRAHVAKLLSRMLEEKLTDCFVDGFWDLSDREAAQERGIRLFSDSKELFKLNHREVSADQVSKGASEEYESRKAKKRKIRLSTSSDSSEDEKIACCAVTARDVQTDRDMFSAVEVNTGTLASWKSGEMLGPKQRLTDGNSSKKSFKALDRKQCDIEESDITNCGTSQLVRDNALASCVQSVQPGKVKKKKKKKLNKKQ